MNETHPILTIDGPSASGKGATASLLAKTLQWHLLDSGSIYRAIAWLIENERTIKSHLTDEVALSHAIQSQCHNFIFRDSRVLYQQRDISHLIRTDEISLLSSQIARIADIRQAVLSLQRSFIQAPGLVADGRDMGSVVFPEALLKIFLTADVDIRAKRRYKQLNVNLPHLDYKQTISSLKQRDKEDEERTIAPLTIPQGAVVINNSHLSLKETVTKIMSLIPAEAIVKKSII